MRAQWLKSTLDEGNVFIGLPETCPLEKDLQGHLNSLDMQSSGIFLSSKINTVHSLHGHNSWIHVYA